MELKNESSYLSRICIENGSNFFLFWRLLKKRSGNDFIFASYMLHHPITIQKGRETHCYVIFHSDFMVNTFFSSCIKKISLENMNEKNQEIFGLNDSSDDQFWRKPFQRSAAASNSSVFFVTMFNLGGRVEMMTDR